MSGKKTAAENFLVKIQQVIRLHVLCPRSVVMDTAHAWKDVRDIHFYSLSFFFGFFLFFLFFFHSSYLFLYALLNRTWFSASGCCLLTRQIVSGDFYLLWRSPKKGGMTWKRWNGNWFFNGGRVTGVEKKRKKKGFVTGFYGKPLYESRNVTVIIRIILLEIV